MNMELYQLLKPDCIANTKDNPAQKGQYDSFPKGVNTNIIEGLIRHGIDSLYAHQTECISSILSGNHTIITTSTASGKSMAYTIPLLNSCQIDKNATAIYITPAKALGQNQKKTIQDIAQKIDWPQGEPIIEVCDGDTPYNLRKQIMNKGNIIVTTPDMLHYSILPNHSQWKRVLENLKYIVIDEAHMYRGILGNNVSHVLRRLRRICSYYQTEPTFILCTATIANAEEFAINLTGLQFNVVSKNTAPTGLRHFVFYQPDENSAYKEAAKLMGQYVSAGKRVILFGRSRRVVELMYTVVAEAYPMVRNKITSYKGTYTPEMRRQLEEKLFSGELKGVIATNALELGIDIGDLDICILCGFPGSISSTWQMGGRAGRKGQESMVVLVANEDPLDQYMINNPDYFFGQPCEKAIVNPDKLQFMAEHLMAAAKELMLTKEDSRYWDKESYYKAVSFLLKQNFLVRMSDSPIMYRPAQKVEKFGLRGIRNTFKAVLENGKVMEQYEYQNLLTDAFPGAIVLVKGKGYLVKNINFLDKFVNLIDLPPTLYKYTTKPKLVTTVTDVKADRENPQAKISAYAGMLTITKTLEGYYLISPRGDKTSRDIPQDLEPHRLRTTGIWLDVLTRNSGAIHALKHLLHVVLPWVAMCERTDIGAFMEGERIYLYDNYEGGVGLAESALNSIEQILERCFELVSSCKCDDGCPSCVQIAQCISNNEGLDKDGVIQLLSDLLQKKISIAKRKHREQKNYNRVDFRLAAREYENKISQNN